MQYLRVTARAGAMAFALLLSPSTAEGQQPCGSWHYGNGSPGSGAVTPGIEMAGGRPLLGNLAFGLRAERLLGGAVTAWMLGLAPASTPIHGVELLVDSPVIATMIASGVGTGAGQAAFALPLPTAGSLSGISLFAQAGTLDPGAARGVAASDGLGFTLHQNNLLRATAAYQGASASDAFSAIHYLGNGRIIAGKRSSQAGNRFLLSENGGLTWRTVACPASTGAHTYFFGQHGSTVFSGTGDTGNACLMKSDDAGLTWSVNLSTAQIGSLIGSAAPKAVFGPVALGGGHWLVNIKSFDSSNSVILSVDDGQTWQVPVGQPGSGVAAWARQMIHTDDDVVLWPSVLTDQIYRSTDQGASWTAATVPGASLFQPLCDAGNGIYLCGDVRTTPNTPIHLHRSVDRGLTWSTVAAVNLQRSTITYWRDVIRVDDTLYASACCVEASSQERFMQLFRSIDDGATWCSLGNPYQGPFGGMQAIYQMCATETNEVFAACQPDSTILHWQQ